MNLLNLTCFRLFALVASLSLLTGCAGEPAKPVGTVTGKVTYKGQPVKEGTITLIDDAHGTGGGAELDGEGNYRIVTPEGGLPPGTYQVAIQPPQVEESSNGNTAPAMVPKNMPDIPEKYRNIRTSELKVVVKEGDNTYDVNME